MSTVTAKSQVRRAQRDHLGGVGKDEIHSHLGKAEPQFLATSSVPSTVLDSGSIQTPSNRRLLSSYTLLSSQQPERQLKIMNQLISPC